MPVTLSIKNVPDEIAQRLRERAARNHRSLQGELMAMLEAAAAPPPRKKSIQEIHEEIQASGLRTESDSTEIVRAMRDSRYGE
ncbi:MAG TPA: Arc family DNA-binding protein [Azospirillaceae bacterium]|nr:Arc family DNA-binding protein [Azospirillaceae bacterium]